MKQEGIKVITNNRRAGFHYSLGDRYRAGIVLTGSEIKSIRRNQINLQDGFVEERDGELWLLNVQITPYEQAGIYGRVDDRRARKLLLHKKEIAQIISRVRERGFTCVPTMVFLERGRAKVEIALAKGKKDYDKRDDIAKRDSDREIRRVMKEGAQE
jgi:SsrA-binding protein